MSGYGGLSAGWIRQTRRNLSIHRGKHVVSGTWNLNNCHFLINYFPFHNMISVYVVELVLNHIISDSELLFTDPVKELGKC